MNDELNDVRAQLQNSELLSPGVLAQIDALRASVHEQLRARGIDPSSEKRGVRAYLDDRRWHAGATACQHRDYGHALEHRRRRAARGNSCASLVGLRHLLVQERDEAAMTGP